MGFESFFEAKKKNTNTPTIKEAHRKTAEYFYLFANTTFQSKGFFFFFLILTFLHVLWLALPHTGVAQSTGSPLAR